VRLTLRTLLAYLDDTLEPSEIRQIGQKVSESDAAQELIARIKQVTRRRRLTTPPATGPNSFDPNTVAEYLDNELSAEQLAEVEKLCLESDVHLAEIASCHQILTLVLGEPALVPPTAKERMYGLVQGREAIPFRKATAPTAPHHATAGAGGDADADEMLLLGLPFYRRSSWLRWALPVAALVILVGLGWALYQAVMGGGGHEKPPAGGETVAQGDKNPGGGDEKKGENKKEEKAAGKNGERKEKLSGAGKEDQGKSSVAKAGGDGKKEPAGTNTERRQDSTGTTPAAPPAAAGRVLPASQERAEAATFVSESSGLPRILVQREAEGTEGWRRLRGGSRIYTSDRLVSLPGYASEIRTDSNVRLVLQGMMREFSRDAAQDFLLESAVVLNKNPQFDADLTLDRGRLFITNIKDSGAAQVRLRFGRDAAEVWDLTLRDPGTEVALDLIKAYTRDINYLDGEDPRMELYFMLLRGRAQLKIDYESYTLDQPSGMKWDNKSGRRVGPLPFPPDMPIWRKPPPERSENLPVDFKVVDDMVVAVKELSTKMVGTKPLGLVLEEVLHGEGTQPAGRRLAIYCMSGLDEVRRLVDALGDEDPNHVAEREAAIYTLRRWISRDANQGKLLYDAKNKTGLLLTGQKYRSGEAKALSILLHDFSDVDRQNRETYELLANELLSNKVAIAELAYWHLRHMAMGVPLPPFNAATPVEDRRPAHDEVLKLIADNKLPPRPQGPPPSASGKAAPDKSAGDKSKPSKP
jgi:hypothetical protein